MEERSDGGIRCSEVLALLSDYLDGDLDSTVVAKVEAHLAACSNCERFGDNFGRMVMSMRSLEPPEALDEGLMNRIRAGIDAAKG